MSKELKFNPSRVFDAISRIGYKPSSAITDIIDNSISADATRVDVIIEVIPEKTLPKHNNVSRITIIDDGNGMDDDMIENALTLGSIGNYSEDSLSKYGLGLKSAGFSLGKRISVTSRLKTKKDFSSWYLDLDLIKDGYKIFQPENLENYLLEFNAQTKASKNGATIIDITNCTNRTIQSAKQIKDELINKLGVTYYHKLSTSDLQINIIIKKENLIIENNSIKAKDILFRDKIKAESFIADSYDGLYPIRVLKEDFDIKGVDRKAKIEVVVFPMAKMNSNINFNPAERELINSYDITTSNHGFFIYRNDRLISWGDRLRNNQGKTIIPRDSLGFRASLNIYTVHDDALNVDVSKQRLDIPDDILEALESICRNPLEYSEQAFKKCREILNKETAETEGENFEKKNENIPDEDPDEEYGDIQKIDQEEAKKRAKLLVKKIPARVKKSGTKVEGDKKGNSGEKELPEIENDKFLKINYSNNLKSNEFWEHGYDSNEGVFAIVNKNHSFYSNVIARLIGKSEVKQSIEGMVWALAAAEFYTIKNLTHFKKEDIEEILKKFQKIFSHNLDNWSNNNNDLKF
jgi:hypothetical protein